jgi:hypothetical protein
MLFLALALGCGKGGRNHSQVTGKVTYKGQPVTGGSIAFHRQGEESSGVYSFNLNSEGVYSGTDLPAEEMVVTIDTEALRPGQVQPRYGPPGSKVGGGEDPVRKKMKEMGAPVGAAPGSEGTYVAIPKKYADKTTSPLKKTLTSGKNEFNFDLTD